MKKKRRKTASPGPMLGYLTETEVLPSKRALRVTARQNPRMARDMTTRPQKKAKVPPVLGGSLLMMGFPVTAERMFWMGYEECMMPENSTVMAT